MAHKETFWVTGTSGFIGGWIAETLFLSGQNVRAGIRSWASAARPGRFPMEIALCNILDKGQIAQALIGVTCVIHCAKGSDETIIDGTRNMLDGALKQGVKRFVHLSTAEVYGNVSGEIDETSPYQYTGNPYNDSKIEAEKLCWEYYRKGLPVTVIRPSIVYGPFGKTWTVDIALKLQSGSWGIFKDQADGICNLVYVADLTSAILLAATNERAIGEAFNLNGPGTPTWNEYFQRFNKALGLPELRVINPGNAKLRTTIMEPVRFSAKFALAHFGGPLKQVSQRFRYAKKLMKSAENSIKTTPRPTQLSLFNRNAIYLTTKSKAMLGYEPRFDMAAGLKMTIKWMEQVGLVDFRGLRE